MNERQELLVLAGQIAARHEDLHPWEVALKAASGDSADYDVFLVGLLHDSWEDGYVTLAELNAFPERIRMAVETLTRDDEDPYWQYIDRIKHLDLQDSQGREVGRIVRRVKLADAQVNLRRCEQSFGFENLAERYRRVIRELT